MFRQISRRRFALAIAVLLGAISAAYAHVGVQPREASAGATEKYTVRVPNEKTVATVEVQVEFPADVQVSAVDEKAGWKLEEKKDQAGRSSVPFGVEPALHRRRSSNLPLRRAILMRKQLSFGRPCRCTTMPPDRNGPAQWDLAVPHRGLLSGIRKPNSDRPGSEWTAR